MKAAILYSGGKDSTMALYKALQKDFEIKYLVSLIPKNPESYMFHYPNAKLTKLQADAMGFPVIQEKTSGVEGEELKDLKRVLESIRSEIDILVVGALASRYQFERVSEICKDLRLELASPLWQKDPEELWMEILDLGFEVVIAGVACEGLGKEWLGRKIDNKNLELLKTLSAKYRFHLCGEGGEFETLVLDAPMFKKKIKILKAVKKWKDGSGFYLVKEAKLVKK